MRFRGPECPPDIASPVVDAPEADRPLEPWSRRVTAAVRLRIADDISSRMLKGAAFTAGSALTGRLVTFGAGIVAARSLGAAGFGTLSLCQSTAVVGASIAGLGLPWVATRMIAALRTSNPGVAYRLWRFLALLCVIMVVVVGMSALTLAAPLTRFIFGSEGDVTQFVVCVWLFAGYAVNNFSQAVLMGTEEFSVAARWSIARAVACSVGLVVGVRTGQPVHAVAGYAVGECLVLLPMFRRGQVLVRVLSRVPPQDAIRAEKESFRQMCQMALAAWGSTLLLHPAFWYTQLLLTRAPGGYAALGVFALAQRAVQAVVMLPGNISLSSVPILTNCWASNRRADFARAVRTYAAGYLAYVLPIAVLAGASAPLSLRLFGPEYAVGWPVFVVLMVATVPMVVNNLLSSMAVASSRSGLWLVSDVGQALALIGAATLLVPRFGGVGASLSYLTASVTTCVALIPVARGMRVTA